MRVYLITNTKNSKRYVGITQKRVESRWYEHCCLAAAGSRQALHRAIRSYKADAFTVEEIDQADSLDELREKERRYIREFNTFTLAGYGYNMTLGGDGVFGFEFPDEVRAMMAEAATKRFARPGEREKQQQRQKRYWTAERRGAQGERAKQTHAANPEFALQHAALMKALSNPETMRKRALALWENPEARERFMTSNAKYWSDPANREKASREIRRRFAEQPNYAKHVSEGKKRHFREHPETAERHAEFMRERARDPAVRQWYSDNIRGAYERDPTLVQRQATSRRQFYVKNPDARIAAAKTSRRKAEARRAVRTELLALAVRYEQKTGEAFDIPSRRDGGWRTDIMTELIADLRQRLQAPQHRESPGPVVGSEQDIELEPAYLLRAH